MYWGFFLVDYQLFRVVKNVKYRIQYIKTISDFYFVISQVLSVHVQHEYL
jgi:hypothetical protein